MTDFTNAEIAAFLDEALAPARSAELESALRVDDGLRFMELDMEMSPGKVWLLRRTAQACLDNGRPEKALPILELPNLR